MVHFAFALPPKKRKKKDIKLITQNTARDDKEEILQPTPVVKVAQ